MKGGVVARDRAVLWLVAAALVAGCQAAGSDSPPDKTAPRQPERVEPQESPAALHLTFEDGAAEVGAVVPGAANAGAAEVETTVETIGGGRVLRAEGRSGGFAIRFPQFTREPQPGAAVLKVVASEAGTFDPGKRAFRFGADFVLDAESGGTEIDDGDNLIQRGLFGDAAQFKIQVDRRVPSCRIQGSAGEVFVKAEREVEPEAWHRVVCERRDDVVHLTVGRFDDDGRLTKRRWTSRGKIGTIDLGAEDSYLSVGGKLGTTGTVVQSSTDQFNGVVDEVFFELIK
jgi:hypothetical protein